jgi:hypothetical protein
MCVPLCVRLSGAGAKCSGDRGYLLFSSACLVLSLALVGDSFLELSRCDLPDVTNSVLVLLRKATTVS